MKRTITIVAMLLTLVAASSASAISFPWGEPGNCNFSTPSVYMVNGSPAAASKVTCSVRPHKMFFNVCLDIRQNGRWTSAGCTSTNRVRPARSSYTANCSNNNRTAWRARAVLLMVDREGANVGSQKWSRSRIFRCG